MNQSKRLSVWRSAKQDFDKASAALRSVELSLSYAKIDTPTRRRHQSEREVFCSYTREWHPLGARRVTCPKCDAGLNQGRSHPVRVALAKANPNA